MGCLLVACSGCDPSVCLFPAAVSLLVAQHSKLLMYFGMPLLVAT
jgi:hypothetical protein